MPEFSSDNIPSMHNNCNNNNSELESDSSSQQNKTSEAPPGSHDKDNSSHDDDSVFSSSVNLDKGNKSFPARLETNIDSTGKKRHKRSNSDPSKPESLEDARPAGRTLPSRHSYVFKFDAKNDSGSFSPVEEKEDEKTPAKAPWFMASFER